MSEITFKQIVEGLLMASEQPLSVDDLGKMVKSEDNSFEISELSGIINELVEDYKERGIELKEVASGWRFHVKPDLSKWISKLYEERPLRYSRALLETLALIAYRQPITRAEIENVRGVTVGTHIMKTLIEHEWVRIIGYKEVPGKPAIFGTTKKFLDYFNLKNLDELPPLIEFTETMLPEITADAPTEIALASETPLDVNENPLVSEENKAMEDASVDESSLITP